MVLKLSYAFVLAPKAKSALLIGPEVGLSFFSILETVDQVAYPISGDSAVARQFTYSATESSRISIGVVIEYEFREIVVKRLSVFFAAHPEVLLYHNPSVKGSDQDWLAGWLSFNAGIRFSFRKKTTP
jgi:hypothetical protein